MGNLNMNDDKLSEVAEKLLSPTYCDLLCEAVARDGTVNPYSGRDFVCAKWGMPVWFLTLAADSLIDFGFVDCYPRLFGAFIAKLRVPKGVSVTVGHFVFAEQELSFLKESCHVPSSLFFGVRNAVMDSNHLLNLLVAFRVERAMVFLAQLRGPRMRAISQPFGQLSGLYGEVADEERFALLAIASAICVAGREVRDDSAEVRFFSAVFERVQKDLDDLYRGASTGSI